jgi:hypothetical protein
MAAKRKPPGRKRPRNFQLRLNDEERERVLALAEAQEVSASQVVRFLIRDAYLQIQATSVLLDEVPRDSAEGRRLAARLSAASAKSRRGRR